MQTQTFQNGKAALGSLFNDHNNLNNNDNDAHHHDNDHHHRGIHLNVSAATLQLKRKKITYKLKLK